MAGILTEILTMRTLTFDNGAGTIVLAKGIPILGWMGGALLIRVHSNGIAASSSITIKAFITAPTPQDPSVDYVASIPVASETIVAGHPAPTLIVAPLSGNPGQFLRVEAVGILSGGACNAKVSLAFVLKRDDPQPGDAEVSRTTERFS